MPNKQDIITAIKNLDLFLKTPELKGAKPRLKTDGSPFVFAGGFNMVFQLVHNTKKWAFRVWHVPMGENKDRYVAISKYLTNSKLPYFADFIYDENGLLVNGELIDTIRMEWLEGLLLKDYIEKHLNDKAQLESLANDFLEMAKTLNEAKISHGDLQEGNILINDSGKIKLVDYDSICIPEIEGQQELVTGLKGYQHPSRFISSKASLKADYFSELIIYISILGIAADPNLWDKYKVKDTQYLLFNEKDFENIESSTIYADLKGVNATIDALLIILKEYLSNPYYLELKPFTEYFLAPEIISFQANKENVLRGAEIEFSWTVENALMVKIEPEIGSIPKQGKVSFIPKKNTYTIICENLKVKAEKELSIEILPPPEVKEFRFDKKKLKRGESTRLIWDVKNIISADLIYNGRRKKIQTWGSMKIAPKRHTEYVLELTALDETTIIRQAQKIEVFEKGSIKKFAVDSHYFLPIAPLTLVWEVYHSKKVVLEGFGEVKPVDSMVVRPKKDTLYKLIVEDEFGVFEEVLQVKEMPMPKIESISAPAPSSFSLPRIHLSTPLYPILQSAPKAIHSSIELNTKNIKLDFLISFETIAVKFLSENLFKKPNFLFNINAAQNAFSSLKQKLKLKRQTK
jgi:serine/threonine protein kinase